ncbi:MAG: Stp1/IreP family PP2C-type Ser/Thr phosphatase [Clostridia bacterium]|nr:Stp1/IreP family PP2C-type Ser/Thr phosphatase [Clostridia bacterium]
MQFFSMSDTGRLRKSNQDCALSKELGSFTLLALADGMGGHSGGEIASGLAIEEISSVLSDKLTEKMLPGQIMLLLSEALDKANAKILDRAKNDSSLSGMGTTCDVCLATKNKLYIAHIGDSRVYKISKGGVIKKLTCDHSLVQFMLESGTITPEEAVDHPQKNVILRALGISDKIEPDVFQDKISPCDVILLCSDGLTNMLDEETVAKAAISEDTPSEIAKKLIGLANEAGGRDNITVVIAKA